MPMDNAASLEPPVADMLGALEPLLVGQAGLEPIVDALGRLDRVWAHQLTITPRDAWIRAVDVYFTTSQRDDGSERVLVTSVRLGFTSSVPLASLAERFGPPTVTHDLHDREGPPIAEFPPVTHAHGVLQAWANVDGAGLTSTRINELHLDWTPAP